MPCRSFPLAVCACRVTCARLMASTSKSRIWYVDISSQLLPLYTTAFSCYHSKSSSLVSTYSLLVLCCIALIHAFVFDWRCFLFFHCRCIHRQVDRLQVWLVAWLPKSWDPSASCLMFAIEVTSGCVIVDSRRCQHDNGSNRIVDACTRPRA